MLLSSRVPSPSRIDFIFCKQVGELLHIPAVDRLDQRQGRLRIVAALVMAPVQILRLHLALNGDRSMPKSASVRS